MMRRSELIDALTGKGIWKDGFTAIAADPKVVFIVGKDNFGETPYELDFLSAYTLSDGTVAIDLGEPDIPC